MIYEGSPAKQLPGLAALIVQNLKENCRCVYLNSPAMVAGIRSYLAAAGLNVAEEVNKGALVLSSDDRHLIEGRFEVERMLSMLTDTIYQALSDGYERLWVTGDMTWELGAEKSLDKLLEYESALERLFRKHPSLSGICQYHEDTLPSEIIHQGLHTHQGVYISETLSRINPYYISPELSANYRLLRSTAELREKLNRVRTQALNS